MTDAQAKRFYFPAWNRALKARWVRDLGRCSRGRGAGLDLADQVEAIATSRAARRAGLSPPKIFGTAPRRRPGARSVEQDLTNAQTDRVVALFDLVGRSRRPRREDDGTRRTKTPGGAWNGSPEIQGFQRRPTSPRSVPRNFRPETGAS